MTDQARAEAERIHGNTKKAADMALAKRAISRESHRAVHEGRISLAEARELGRNAGPSGPAVRADKRDRSRLCMCGCGRTTKNRFAQGHDQILLRHAYEHLRGERELTEEQLAYVRDESDKLERAQAQVEKEKAKASERREREEVRKRRERAAKKAER